MIPKDLVCARCWRDFFNTEAFEKCCTCDLFGIDYKHTCVHAVAVNNEIVGSSCTWCAYIRSFIGDSLMPEDRVAILLAPVRLPCTPRGNNIFYLSIDCTTPAGKSISGWALKIHAWTLSDDVAAEYVTAGPVRTDVNSGAATMQIKKWLEECEMHECCSAANRVSNKLPTRVIEVDPPGRQNPRLLESRDLHGHYTTLSYCWGKTPFPTLTRSSYGQFLDELDFSRLPPTIRDAITTTRNLSIPYLWVDALCIIQDSEEDKTREIAEMKHVYASSTMTIVAASAKNVFEGFLHPRLHSEPSHPIPVRIKPDVFGTMFINELDAACYDERFEPIAKRAWTMQEQALAQRTLTFTNHTMMWACHGGTRNFGDSLYFPHDLDSGFNDHDETYTVNLNNLLLSEEEAYLNRDKALSCWLRLVTAYSLRTASHERDKLNAVAGIASNPSFSRALGPGYFAGLWQYGLARQLVWHTSEWHRTLPDDETFVYYRPALYRAPSWSWASLDGGVINFDFYVDDEDDEIPQIMCDIAHCSAIPTFPELNPLGEVASAELRIKTFVRKAWFQPSTSNIFLLPPSTFAEVPYKGETITIAEASADFVHTFIAQYPEVDLGEEPEATNGTDHRNMCGTYDESGVHDPTIVFCLAIIMSKRDLREVEGLIVVPREVQGKNAFSRIGTFKRGRKEDFETETRMEITIV